ncbi:MAG TPA: helix-turn-helix domain-containing protein [Herpetosiphonaceae bacterium]|nr:helix-turn-helix domain-containing protein [Herpetosiphonaceae bacterium]
MAELDELINAREAAAHMGVTRTRIYALTRAGKIGRKVGGFWLYTRAELDAYKAQRNPQGGRPKAHEGPLRLGSRA